MNKDATNLIILSMDTSSRNCSIAISKEKLILTEYNFVTGDKLSSVLILAIEFVLNSAKLKMHDINLFGIGIGPGLFTGIRIGLSTLKGLLTGENTPVVPVVTLKALAYKYNRPDSLVIPLIDARRNQLYMGGYKIGENEITEVISPDLIQVKDLPARLQGWPDCHFIGDGAEAYKDYLKRNFSGNKYIHRSSFLASEICKIAHDGYSKNQYTTNLQELKPFYLKKPDAEESLRHGNNHNT